MIPIPMEVFSIPAVVMCIPAGTICIPAGTISNKIPMGDNFKIFGTHRIEFITCKNKYLLQSEFAPVGQNFYPTGTIFLSRLPMFGYAIIGPWLKII